MSVSFIMLFSLTVFIASIIPGPSMLLALSHGMQYGTRKTLASAMGNVLVSLIQASISIAGLGTILMASRTLFMSVKWIGVAYLCFIGFRFFISKEPFKLEYDDEGPQSISTGKMFIQAMVVTAANPKAILFFTAIFPQFIDIESSVLIQSLILLAVLGIIAFLCFMAYALGGQKIFSLFSETHLAKYIKKLFGLTFIGAGVGLAVS